MGKVRLLAVVVGEWAVPVLECSILNVFCVVAREKLNAEFVEVLAKENVIKDEKDYVSLLSIQLLSLQFEGGFDATYFCLKSLIYLEALLHGRAAVDDCAVVAVADELTDT